MIEKLKLHNETELWLEPDVATQTVEIFLYDVYNETKTRLVTWQGNKGIPGGNWISNHFGHKNKFFNKSLAFRIIVFIRVYTFIRYSVGQSSLWVNG